MASYPALDLRFAPGPGAGTLQDMLYAELDAFEPVAIHEHETGDGWRVFFRTPALRDRARGALASEFENALELHAVDVDDEDWARRSQAALKAIRAGRIVVAPPWDVPPTREAGNREPANREARTANREAGNREPANREARTANREADNREPANREARTANRDLLIVIDPSTGFGTGHHATTRLCLELLQEIDVRGKRVIDVGTGSGVLAIAAAKLEAASVIAIDNDPDALQNARENVDRNEVSAAIQIIDTDLAGMSVAVADVVVANLTGAVLQRYAAALKRLVAPAGVLIASGFSPGEAGDVAGALGLAPLNTAEEDDWAAVCGRLR